MPKIIELTVEIEVQRVSCPGVWLCQDGRVSLTLFALGTNYQTCLLPPIFPLMFKDIFYFRKRFQETCALNNICCLLKNETIYCELVQWCEDCDTGECTILAQYLGALNDVLFPPNMCSNDGVDLLMRRSKDFPGILSPKIEIATKVRIDEVWNQPCSTGPFKPTPCHCAHSEPEGARQKQVCHTAKYHRSKCNTEKRSPAVMRSRSRSRSGGSKSCSSITHVEPETNVNCRCPNPIVTKSRTPSRERRYTSARKCREYSVVYSVQTPRDSVWRQNNARSINYDDTNNSVYDETLRVNDDTVKTNSCLPSERIQTVLLASNYIDQEAYPQNNTRERSYKITKGITTPCVCEICKRYHELFHINESTKS